MTHSRRAASATLAAFLLGVVAFTGRADDNKAKQIADVEKQVAELQQKLDEMKKKSAATPAGKKALTTADADVWRSVRGTALSADGKWFAHRVAPGDGSGDVILRAVADGKETKFPGGGGFGSLDFSFDAKWFAFTVSPPAPKPGVVSIAPRAKPKVVLVNLATAATTEFEGMSSFQFGGESATHLAFRKAAEAPAVGPTLPPGLPPGLTIPGAAAPSSSGADLVLHDLASGTDLVLGNVAEYSFDKKGKFLVLVIEAAGQIGNGVQLLTLATGAVAPIDTAKASYRGLTWNRDNTAFALLKGVEDKAYEAKWNTLLAVSDLGPKPTLTTYDPKSDAAFPKGFGLSSNRPAVWTDDLTAVTLGIAAQKPKETAPPPKDATKKDTSTAAAPPRKDVPTTAPAAKPDLVVWHWKDEKLQPAQEKMAAFEKSATYLSTYRVKEKKFVRLADDECKTVSLPAKAKFALGQSTKPYDFMSTLDGKRFSDVYSIDPATGAKTKVLTKARYVFGTNPAGTLLLHYDDGHFFALDLATGKSVNLTQAVTATTFIDADDDHNVTKPPTRPLGWSRDGKSVILSDDWDLWKVAADGSGGENLTGNGKKDGIRYTSFSQFEPEPREPGLDLAKPAFVGLYGEWTKKAGYGKWEPGKTGVAPLVWADASVSGLQKARTAEVYTFSRGTAVEYPDVYLATATLADAKKVTNANPQQAEYLWTPGTKLVEYTGTGGKKLQGALFLPANYEPGKKYPTVVYIYEKLSQGLHGYTPPAAGGSGFNKSIYTSNGYAVFMPDITYRLNDPGVSAVECILPGLDAAIATGVVDGEKVGLQGHSWGGYQTAFLVTQTNRFKAAVAGAPLTDMVSMYSSVYWNSGSANQPIFESSQGRFTGGYWVEQQAYIRNSPVYHATNVNTPLVILHNDKDGAVDFVQGIEYYNTLRRLQKPVVMLQYKGENHGLAKPENQKDYAARMKEFFDHYLVGKPAPDWWKDGVSHLKMDEHLKGRKP